MRTPAKGKGGARPPCLFCSRDRLSIGEGFISRADPAVMDAVFVDMNRVEAATKKKKKGQDQGCRQSPVQELKAHQDWQAILPPLRVDALPAVSRAFR